MITRFRLVLFLKTDRLIACCPFLYPQRPHFLLLERERPSQRVSCGHNLQTCRRSSRDVPQAGLTHSTIELGGAQGWLKERQNPGGWKAWLPHPGHRADRKEFALLSFRSRSISAGYYRQARSGRTKRTIMRSALPQGEPLQRWLAEYSCTACMQG